MSLPRINLEDQVSTRKDLTGNCGVHLRSVVVAVVQRTVALLQLWAPDQCVIVVAVSYLKFKYGRICSFRPHLVPLVKDIFLR